MANLICINRIKKDLENFAWSNPEGISIVPDEDNMTTIHALIVGPRDTPYEGGFFYFIVECPSEYPFKPPKVTFMTTGEGNVRFNPNLYKNGKVCLSILGTVAGPPWVAGMNLCTVLLSIQSLLNEYPLHNTPGLDKKKYKDMAKSYNDVVLHETLRVAVVQMMEKPPKNYPQKLREDMEKSFKDKYDHYVSTSVNNKHLNGRKFQVYPSNGTFDYDSILMRLQKVKETMLRQEPSNVGEHAKLSDAPASLAAVNIKELTAEFTAVDVQNDTAGQVTANIQNDTAGPATANVQNDTGRPVTANVQNDTAGPVTANMQNDTTGPATANMQNDTVGPTTSIVQGATAAPATYNVQGATVGPAASATSNVQGATAASATSNVQGATAASATSNVQGATAASATSNVQGATAGLATSNVQGATAGPATSNVQGATAGPATSNVQGDTAGPLTSNIQ